MIEALPAGKADARKRVQMSYHRRNRSPDTGIAERAMDQLIGNLAWMPPSVRRGVDRYEAEGLAGEGLEVAARLRTDSRLERVHEQLKQTDRKTGGYRWCNRLADPSIDPGEALDDVLGWALYLAARVVRDGIVTDKGSEPVAKKVEMLHEARVMRKIADDLVARNPTDPLAYERANAVYVVSCWWEAGAYSLRGSGDPLTIERDHGDNLQRAVQIYVAKTFEHYLGHRMDGLAAIIAGVALGKPELDASVSRSALTRSKSTT
jgi:hypothetical protein